MKKQLVRASSFLDVSSMGSYLGISLLAELWGLYEELKLAFSKGISCLEVHVDSKSMVDSIKGGKNGCVVGLRLIKGIQQLLAQEWTIKLVSIFKEANKCVDAIANEACEMEEDLMIFSNLRPF
ncbi:hypothetical protein JHK87_031440 [Glycine soja]|nr:hypothetical protein JHK87_031440 [Glycine soja]